MSKPSKLITKILKHFVGILPFAILVGVSIPIIGMAYIETSKILGIRKIPVEVIGTGSMYPSLFWATNEGGPEDEQKIVVEEYRTTPHLYSLFRGFSFHGHSYFRRQVNYGDMVSFKNSQTAEILLKSDKDPTSGFIKRIIGTPGDTIELRDGFVYRNGKLLEEPYISSPRSTYGGSSLKDCSVITVPQGNYFVLGDNRKISSDSRFELGFINEADIQFILPYAEQKIYHSLWRDTSKDSQLLGQPTLQADEFVSLVNKERAKQGLKNLAIKPSLVKSATSRGEHLLDDDKTNYDLHKAISSFGYNNIVLGEFVSYGHFSAQELLENLLYNQETAKQIRNKDFSDIGVSDVNREIDGCPTQIVVGHLGGYVPASYDPDTIKSWSNLRDNLHEVIPSWEKAVDYHNIDQAKLATLLTIFRRRLDLAEEIIKAMEKKDWLTEAQQDRIKADEEDANTAATLSKELNTE